MEVNSSTQTVSVTQPVSTPSSSSGSTSATAIELLPPVQQLACSGDPGAMVAALAVQSSKTQRDIARAERNDALKAQGQAETAEIQDMRDKANLQRAQGIVSGALQMAQGACDLASGLNDVKAAQQQAEADRTAADLKTNGSSDTPEQRNALQAKLDSLNTAIGTSKTNAAWDRAAGAGFGAGKSVADGLFSGAITDKDADAKVHDVAAQSFKQIADDAHDTEKDAQATIDKAIDFYKEYVDTKAQAAMAAVHRA